MSIEHTAIFNPEATLIPNPELLGSLSRRERFNLQRREDALRQWPRTGQGAVQRMLEGGNVRWDLLPAEDVAGILVTAGQELQIPPSMFRNTELTESLDMLGGRTLTGLFKFVLHHPARKEKPVVPFLMEQVGIKATGNDIAQAMKMDRQVEWGHIPEGAIGEVLELAAQEVDKPVHMLNVADFTRPLETLGGKSLKGLFNRYDTLPERDGKDTVNFILERTGVETSVFNKLRALGSTAFFDQASWDEIGEILRRTADEIGKPVSMLTANDIRGYNVQFLGGRTLRDLKLRMDKDKVGISELPQKIGTSVTLEDVLETAKSDNFIIWNRISIPVFRQLLDMAATEKGKPTSLLTVDDLKGPFQFLEGKSLGGLHNYINKRPRPEGKTSMPFLLEQMGIPVVAEDVVTGIRKDLVIWWDRVPWTEMRRILGMAADELGIPTEMIGSPELIQRFDFLERSTLLGMYWFAGKHPQKRPDESTVSFLRRQTGIEDGLRPKRSSRLKFRAQQINTIFQDSASTDGQLSEVDSLLPSIHSVARLYANPFLGIEVEEIESEAIVYALSFMSEGKPVAQFPAGLNGHLEQYTTELSRPRYKELLFSTPTSEDGTRTIGDKIYSKKDETSDGTLSDDLVERLSVLTEFQKELVMKIVIDDRTFEELEEELGMDSDTLQESYYDALTLLRTHEQ